jgi:predicted acylesterase/phospholipase RssA
VSDPNNQSGLPNGSADELSPDASDADVQPISNRLPRPPIDLALSGGGFRATLFHLGVIGFLRDHKLLSDVKNICSVSGGSILAAHLVTYWLDYIDPKESIFRKRVQQLIRSILTRDISGNVWAKSKLRVLMGRPLNTEHLVGEYRALLGAQLTDIRRWDDLLEHDDRPDLHILATHLNTGRPGAYTKTGFHIPPADPGLRHEKEINSLAHLAEC